MSDVSACAERMLDKVADWRGKSLLSAQVTKLAYAVAKELESIRTVIRRNEIVLGVENLDAVD